MVIQYWSTQCHFECATLDLLLAVINKSIYLKLIMKLCLCYWPTACMISFMTSLPLVVIEIFITPYLTEVLIVPLSLSPYLTHCVYIPVHPLLIFAVNM
ncbi:hypothetical protein DAI22_06g020500 [Oryza sativa Japonica Group]|nr:hypothetical protein DAI22_06g020500 [Oryza sativa Japonica Group]